MATAKLEGALEMEPPVAMRAAPATAAATGVEKRGQTECTGLRGVLVVPVEVHLAEEAPAETAGVAAAVATWAVAEVSVGVLDLQPSRDGLRRNIE